MAKIWQFFNIRKAVVGHENTHGCRRSQKTENAVALSSNTALAPAHSLLNGAT
jgi:hypothetical protein